MPLNIPGILVPFQLLLYPRLVVPSLLVKDIRQINFPALKNAGYKGAVFDKDNCLTLPHQDTLLPELEEAWKLCRETFGHKNVVIVSNSAGTRLDAGGIQSESVQHYLKVPVLSHKAFKPAYSCIAGIRSYFSSLSSPVFCNELIVVGDRVFTDVVLANRMRMQGQGGRDVLPQPSTEEGGRNDSRKSEHIPSSTRPRGPLAIWTTGVWEHESMLMRWMEKGLVKVVERWSTPPKGQALDIAKFVNDLPPAPEAPKRSGFVEELSSIFRRT